MIIKGQHLSIAERIAFLTRIDLFHGLDNEELKAIAEKLEEASVPAGGKIFEQDHKASSFYLIYHGKVHVTRKRYGKDRQLAILKNYDYFGETDLVLNRWRSATVVTIRDTFLLVLSREDFLELYQEIAKLKRRRLYSLISIKVPQIIGQFVLDILGRDKASVTTAIILGWLIIIGLILVAFDIITPDLIINIWNSSFSKLF